MPVLKLTRDLLQSLQQGPYPGDIVLSASIAAILRSGSIEDASAVLEYYEGDPFSFKCYELLEIVKRWGNVSHGERIFSSVIEQNRIKDAVDPVVLEIIGVLGYGPAKDILVHYTFNQDDYYLHKHAALGLLCLDCGDLEQLISAEIKKICGTNLFPEFIPALVCKLSCKGERLRELYETGSRHASADCNAGILLGFARSGIEGKEFFRKALFNPAWEVYSTASGARRFAFHGMLEQNFSFVTLFEEVQEESKNGNGAYALTVFLSLLEESVYNFAESMWSHFFTHTYLELFGGTNSRLQILAEEEGMEDEFLRFQRLMELKVFQEISLDLQMPVSH